MRTIWIIYDISFISRGTPFTVLKALKSACAIHQVISKEVINDLTSPSSTSLQASDLKSSMGLMANIITSPDFTSDLNAVSGQPLPPSSPPEQQVRQPPPQRQQLSKCVKLAVDVDKTNHGDLIIVAADDKAILTEIVENKLESRNIFYASKDQDLLDCLNKPASRYLEDGGEEKSDFKDGLRHGKQLNYNKAGRLVRETTWDNGYPLNIIEYDAEGLKHGRETIFFPKSQIIQLELIWNNGALLVEGNYNLEGQKHGVERHFAPDGRVTKELLWENGRQVVADLGEPSKAKTAPAEPTQQEALKPKPQEPPQKNKLALKPAGQKPPPEKTKPPKADKKHVYYPGTNRIQKEISLCNDETVGETSFNIKGQKHGKELAYYPGTSIVSDERIWDNGFPVSETHFNTEGEKDGKEVEYHHGSKKPRSVKTWVKSILGSMVNFNASGQRDGKEILYFIDDNKREERIWGNDRLLCKVICDSEGRKDGQELVFSPDDGRITRKITWLNNFIIEHVNYNEQGKKHGKEQQFLNKGLKEITWENGYPVKNTCYDSNGRKSGREIVFYSRSHHVKQAITWSNDSCVRIENYDLNGKKHGDEIEYMPEGEKITKWTHGTATGEKLHPTKR